MRTRLVVVGNGMVGHKLIECLMGSDLASGFEVVTFCEEPRLAYDRVHLSEFFSGKTAEDLSLVEPGFYERHEVTVHLGDKAVAIDRAAKLVRSEQGRELPYDKLVLATGSYPFVPPVPGRERPGCFVYRTIEDLEAITEGARGKTIGTVVGGGLLGLEAANALKNLGLETHVVEFAPRLMTVQVDDGGGAILRHKIQDLGVQVHVSKNTTAIVDGGAHAHRMNFADGDLLGDRSHRVLGRDPAARRAGARGRSRDGQPRRDLGR